MLRISRYLNEFDSHPTAEYLPWADLARELTTHRFNRETKRGLPCFSPAELVPNAPSKQARYVLRVHFGVVDLDDISVTDFERVLLAAQATGPGCMYTTWSHPEAFAEGLYRLRLVVPFRRPVEVKEWPAVWPKMVAKLGGICDAKCSNADRIYYGPFMPPGTESMAWSVVW